MKRIKLGTLLTIILGLILASCSGTTPATNDDESASQDEIELVKVVYGVSPFQDTYLPALGETLGYYEEEGLDVEFEILGWTEVQEALAAGEIDVAINNISSVIATHENWPEFVYYYGVNIFDAGAALMAKPEYKSVDEFMAEGMSEDEAIKAAGEQMVGKVVVTTGNTDMEQAVLGVAYRNGLDFTNDFEVVDMNPDEGLAAFLSGTGDFFLGGLPQRTRATKEGYKPIIVGAQLAPPPLNGLVTTKDYAENNQDTLLKLIKVWFRIANYVEENTETAGDMVVTTLNEQTGANMTVADFTEFWQNWEHYPLSASEVQRDIIDPSGYSYWKARFDDCNWYFYDVKGSIKAPVLAEDAIMIEEVHKAYVEKYGE